MGSSFDSSDIVESTPQSPNATSGVIRTLRDVAPAHYLFKIKSFSLLSKILSETGLDKYESRVFEASGYKWKLSVYPEGDKKRNGDGFISMQLEISDTTDLPPGWEVKVYLLCFVYDQLRDKYLTVQDCEVRRFHALKKEDGFPQLISLSTFNDSSNGYLMYDCCIFGVEVFTIKTEGKGESVSVVTPPVDNKLVWRLENFSELDSSIQYSTVLSAGGCEWKLRLYPKGDSRELNKSLSIFLEICDNSKLMPGWKVFVEFKLCLKDQLSEKDSVQTVKSWFTAGSFNAWGYPSFILLQDLNSTNGYLVSDTMIVELTINCITVVKDFP